jgi:CDP-paratose 2-epimerase
MRAPGPVSRGRGNGHETVPHTGRALITGGAGFIGTNLAARLLSTGWRVVVLDTLTRRGVEINADWLRKEYSGRVEIREADVRDARAVDQALDGVSDVFHLAAQVAVTSSLETPTYDFSVNAFGTLTLLEAIRARKQAPRLLFTSTNKVYGDLEDLTLVGRGRRYEPQDPATRQYGVDERRPLAFHSPYGCSKGSADQYVLDYARTFGLQATVFRMSCIYGPHQFGNEDQGWVAHFVLQALRGEPLTIYGDGRQVRDVLFVDDLLDAMLAAHAAMDRIGGQAFNIGGGPGRAISLLELLDTLARLLGHTPRHEFGPWRAADQRFYVSDCRRFAAATNWAPRVSVRDGLRRLADWLEAHHPAVRLALARTAVS